MIHLVIIRTEGGTTVSRWTWVWEIWLTIRSPAGRPMSYWLYAWCSELPMTLLVSRRASQ